MKLHVQFAFRLIAIASLITPFLGNFFAWSLPQMKSFSGLRNQ
jgi:hypothetical protein